MHGCARPAETSTETRTGDRLGPGTCLQPTREGASHGSPRAGAFISRQHSPPQCSAPPQPPRSGWRRLLRARARACGSRTRARPAEVRGVSAPPHASVAAGSPHLPHHPRSLDVPHADDGAGFARCCRLRVCSCSVALRLEGGESLRLSPLRVGQETTVQKANHLYGRGDPHAPRAPPWPRARAQRPRGRRRPALTPLRCAAAAP